MLQEQISDHPIHRLRPVMQTEDLLTLQKDVRKVHIGKEILHYVVAILNATRKSTETRLGVSPRGGLALMHSAQAHAFLHGLSFVTPDSVKAVAPYVIPHRILLDPHREHTGLSKKKLVEDILGEVAVPTMPHEKIQDRVSP